MPAPAPTSPSPARGPRGTRGARGVSGARLAELGALYLGLPLALTIVPRALGFEPPVLPALLLLALALGVALARDPHFDARREVRWGWPRGELRRVLVRFASLGLALAALVAWTRPEAWLQLPRSRPRLFALVVVAYPLLSVVPQELAFRLWFRRRYACFFGRGAGFVVASAAAFGFAHVVFRSWTAVGLTAVGGALFAATFRRTGSLGLVTLEHALYGLLVFTIGLGGHFYAGSLRFLGGGAPSP